ncbi:Crp/Fnr family transcriptional regulator [Sphingobacterium sp. SGG-5]|uniref:Crp/Fnr family transcriptional regulator n=1 Tax=Sphingobacterium sp. SGG-5 TaxID=2710881 RepID=UPI0013EBB5D4|nr:Crp/Fnr family transcriptional regulator [Sphingobacterium sp. SGG-5]NGM62736.1 Crp/Fnr family transcriptional regulator [Sphingobacterium sp. SGG-5]
MDILRFAYQHPSLQPTDLDIICDAHTRADVAKGEFLLQKDQVANEYYVVESGLVRTYVYDFEGNEITTGFMGNQEVVIEVASIFHHVPTQEYMQCLTDCVLWKIDFGTFQDLFDQIPAFREWGRAWMAFELYRSKMRATEMITETAAKRYLRLIQEKPQIIQQAPLKYIASYLGVTDSSLSRIRKEITQS